jgi:hypothetical protein
MTQASTVELLIGNLLTWLLIFIAYVAVLVLTAKWIGKYEDWLIKDMSDSEEDI